MVMPNRLQVIPAGPAKKVAGRLVRGLRQTMRHDDEFRVELAPSWSVAI
jgi:hypothetical protein